MAITYWAEVTLAKYQEKYRAKENYYYVIRVFRDDDGTEDQLGMEAVFSGFGERYHADIHTIPLNDCDIGKVDPQKEDDNVDGDKDKFVIRYTPKTSGKYTPSFKIEVKKEGLLSNTLVATTDPTVLQANPSLKEVTFKVPRQNANSIVSTSPGGQNIYQTDTIPSLIVSKAKVPPKMILALEQYNPAAFVNTYLDGVTTYQWAECTKSWVSLQRSARWVNPKTGAIRTHDSMMPVATTDYVKDGFYKQWQYLIFEITDADAQAHKNLAIPQLKSGNWLKVTWRSSAWDWTNSDSTFNSVGKTTDKKFSNKNAANAKFKKLTEDSSCVDTPDEGDGGDDNSSTPEPPVQVTGIKFNPPPHSTTRSFSTLADKPYMLENAGINALPPVPDTGYDANPTLPRVRVDGLEPI